MDQSVIMRIINKLNTTYSKDLYNLDTAFFFLNGSVLVKPLTHHINLSIRTGQFPDSWRKSIGKAYFQIWEFR